MCNLFENSPDLNGIDLLQLTGDEYATYAYKMQIGQFVVDFSILVVPVQELYGFEEGLGEALVGRGHFDHPVNHFYAEGGSHFLVREALIVAGL